MQISNLKVGQVVKNYNELCKILGVEPKPSNNTNGRKAHQKEFERYFSYDKQGQKYIIINIHSKIKDKVDKRGGNNKVYQEDFENLMVNTIHKKIDTEEMLLSKGQIFKVVELCNDNYTYARRNIPKLSELLEISKESIYDFYDNNNSKLTSIVERNLKAMRSKSMLMYESVVCVCINDSFIPLNELRNPIVENDKVISFNEKVHREATKEEKALILKYENESKMEMCVKDNKDIFLKGRWREYKELVEQKLKDNYTNIEYYYDSYKITWDKDKIEEEYNKLSNEQINSSRNDINNNIIKSIDKSTKTRHTKAKNKHAKYNIDIFRSSDTYVDEQLKISDTIINRNTKDLRNQLKQSVKTNNNTKTMSNIETEQLELKWDLQSLSNDVPF